MRVFTCSWFYFPPSLSCTTVTMHRVISCIFYSTPSLFTHSDETRLLKWPKRVQLFILVFFFLQGAREPRSCRQLRERARLLRGELRGTPAVKNLNLMQPSYVLMTVELLPRLEGKDYSSQESRGFKWCVCVIRFREFKETKSAETAACSVL